MSKLKFDTNNFPVLNCQRLQLSELTKRELDALFQLYSNQKLLHYTDNKVHRTLNDTRQFLSKVKQQFENQQAICWGLQYTDACSLIGTAQLYDINHKHHFASLGCLLMPEYQSKGLMTEAIQSIINHAFKYMRLHRIEAQIQTENQTSIRLFEKLGFEREGLVRENFLIAGVYESAYWYSLLNQSAS